MNEWLIIYGANTAVYNISEGLTWKSLKTSLGKAITIDETKQDSKTIDGVDYKFQQVETTAIIIGLYVLKRIKAIHVVRRSDVNIVASQQTIILIVNCKQTHMQLN